ncbi:MAG: DUF1501 domain-containing protein [Gemmataceae bacterium]|nr:DUF1501 domain-containing protein [Gemmataceae bacterium]
MTSRQNNLFQVKPQRLVRRDFLRLGGLALGGLTLPNLLQATAGKGAHTSLILVFCWGGPSHLETYDLKPEGPENSRSVFKPIPTAVPGMSICEHLPLQAAQASRFSLIRSLRHKINIHNDGSILTLTGKEPSVLDPTSTSKSEHPDLGMIVGHLRGPHPRALPQYVSIPNNFHMTRVNYLGPGCQGFATGDVSTPGYQPGFLSLRGMDIQSLSARRSLLGRLDQWRGEMNQAPARQGMGVFQNQAMDVLTSPEVARAFQLHREPEILRDRYGRHLWGQGCLLARRLAEAGVAVTSVTFDSPKSGPDYTNWDDHPGNAMRPGHFGDYMKRRLPFFDQALSALISDLFERGLDRKVMVAVIGEFGRTPQIRKGPPDNSIGRDHWPDAYSALISGGGLRMGQVVGSTNARGEYPKETPLGPQDVLATLYRHLGIDPEQHLNDKQGKPVPILPTGKPIAALV